MVFIKRPLSDGGLVHVTFTCTLSQEPWTESSDWSVSLSKGREGAGPAIWKSIITGLMPAPFTSADLVSASLVKSELGGLVLPRFGTHYAVNLTKHLSL